jgi:hypothetical protein
MSVLCCITYTETVAVCDVRLLVQAGEGLWYYGYVRISTAPEAIDPAECLNVHIDHTTIDTSYTPQGTAEPSSTRWELHPLIWPVAIGIPSATS